MPPGMEPDFQKGIFQNQQKTMSDTDFDRLLSQRSREIGKRGPMPNHAPNFETGKFRSTSFQSMKGAGYQPAGQDVLRNTSGVNRSDYESMLSSRKRDMRKMNTHGQNQNQQRQFDPNNFKRMIRPLRKQITI